jgi:hypothetical protein
LLPVPHGIDFRKFAIFAEEMKLKTMIVACLILVLGACAHINHATPDQAFETFRAEVRMEREAGRISAVTEQEKLRDRFWQIYGKDADSAGHFAYAVSLMRSAEAGDFPMKEAQALVAARESEMFALKMVARQVTSSYEYPPN